MAVIYLPPDTRWSDVGKGLGSLLGNVVQQQYLNKVASGVAEIRNDPGLSNNVGAQMTQIAQRFGQPGLKLWGEQLANEAKVAQIGLYGGEAAKAEQQTRQLSLENRLKEQTLPTQEQMPAAQLAHLQGQTAALGASTALEQARIPGAAAESAIAGQRATRGYGTTQAKVAEQEVPKAEAETTLKQEQADILKAQVDNLQNLFKPVNPSDPNSPTMLDNTLKQNGITDPQDVAAAKQSLITDPTGKGFNKFIQDFRANQRRLEKPDLLPTDMRRTLDSAAATSSNLAPFLEPNSGAEGLVGGVKAWLAKKGVDQDPQIMAAATAGEQNMAHFAESGAGFGGAWRVKLGADVTPQPGHSPIYNVLVTGQIARSVIDRLDNMKAQVETKPSLKGELASIDKQIATYQKFLDDANTMKWGYDKVDKQGNGTGKLHYYYRGQEVDKNLNVLPAAQSTLLDPSKTYRLVNGNTASGDYINKAALGYIQDGKPVAGLGQAPITLVMPAGQQ